MGVRVNLIINEDMSRGVTVAEDRQTGGFRVDEARRDIFRHELLRVEMPMRCGRC
ncbi:MAG: hypothetical protein QOG58_3739 [Caballeronia sp.]|nr:hypothetical protein [Caballeronia sp.]